MTADMKSLQRRIGAFPIELPAAAALAFAVALATMALPDWRFESAVRMTGLPALVSAAAPPLGTTARVLVALILSACSFAAVFMGLRALDREDVPSDFPAFRTADLHPDAPRRRPILAGAEFGPLVDDLPPIEAQLARAKVRVSEPMPESQSEPPFESRSESMPSFMAPQPPETADFMEPSEDAGFKEIVEDADMGEPVPGAAFTSDPVVMPAFLKIQANAVDDAHFEEDGDDAFAQDDVAPRHEVDATPESDSVTRLMARLETGLARQGGRMRPGAADPARTRVRRALVDLGGGAST